MWTFTRQHIKDFKGVLTQMLKSHIMSFVAHVMKMKTV